MQTPGTGLPVAKIFTTLIPPTYPRAVLFDWDNTLVENWLAIQAAFNAALTEAGRPPLDLEQVKYQARHASREIFPKLFGDDWPRARATFYRHFERNHLAGLRLMAGAEAVLDALGEQDVPLAVVSNKKGDLLRREIRHLGWSGRFGAVVGSLDAPADKPDPIPVRLALSLLGLETPVGVWLVGDTDVDMRAAHAAGCVPVLVGPGPSNADLLKEVEPAVRCHNCTGLAGLIRSLTSTISTVSQGSADSPRPNNNQRQESVNER